MGRRGVIPFFVLLLAAISEAAEPLSILPSATDSRITAFNSAHLAWFPEGTPRNQLLVHLPGTGGNPQKGTGRAYLELAAAAGYHVIFLMYPDNIAAQKKCGQSLDPGCQLKFRNEILTGGRIGRNRTILSADSIEGRLESLLRYLVKQYAGRGWEQYVQSGGGLQWRRIAVSGMSQGGGHVYVLGKNHEVARVVMFGSPKDYSHALQRPARGFDRDSKTPIRRFFAYNHTRDDGNGCTHAQQITILEQMGLNALGVANVDEKQPPYDHAHVLYTNHELPDSTRFHASVLANRRVNPPVWNYLLTEPVD